MSQKRHVIHGRDHLPTGADPIPGLLTSSPPSTFFDAVMALAATSSLRGYWRLGEGALGPYADSKPAGTWVNTPMARIDNTIDLSSTDPGALTVDDDGAVQFNSSTGSITSDYLEASNVWGTGAANPFEGAIGTVAGWVKPFASASTFDGGIFTMLAWAAPGQFQGYVLGVTWPSRSVFYQCGPTRLTGPILTANEWVFAVAVHDTTSNRIYLNGALVATGPAASPTPGTNVNPIIGLSAHSVGTGSPGALYGAVDEVSVWGVALNDTQIATLWGAGTGAAGGGTGGKVVDSFAKLGATRLTGHVTISPGSNVTLTQAGQNIQIAATAGASLLWEDV